MSRRKRERFIDYLPALYHEDEAVSRFLAPFEEVYSQFEAILDRIDALAAPALAPAADFLPWLAGWVALVLDEGWDEAQRRQLIAEAVSLYRLRGTVQGLKRFLKIYTGLEPDIRECRWPAGMQIGVASQIGDLQPQQPLSRIESSEHSSADRDLYVVDTVAGTGHPILSPGEPIRYLYRSDCVAGVSFAGEDEITIERLTGGDCTPGGAADAGEGAPATETITHKPATIRRRDNLRAEQALIDSGSGTFTYTGNGYLIDEREMPYRFIVDVHIHPAERERIQLDKVRAIVDLEKPAHTLYYLKLTPLVDVSALQAMQVEVRSTVGVDTIPG